MSRPTANVETRTRIVPTLRGRVLLGLGLGALLAAALGGDPDARLAAALLLAPIAIDLLGKPRRLHLAALRLAPRRTVVGAPFSEAVLVEAPPRAALRGVLLLEPRTMRSEPPALLPTLQPGAAWRAEVHARSLQRGRLGERTFVLTSGWPLGLFTARATRTVAAELVTEPARVSLRADWLAALAEQLSAPRDRTDLAGPEFHSLRELGEGEDARTVHALRSASLGTLVRRITEGRAPRTVGLGIDLRRPPGRPARHANRHFEWCLGAAATLIAQLRARGADVEVLVLGETATTVRVHGPVSEQALLALLAGAAPTAHRPCPAEALAPLAALRPCYWLAAGEHTGAAEFAALPGGVAIAPEDAA